MFRELALPTSLPRVNVAQQLLRKQYGSIPFAQVPKRGLTKSFVGLSIENSRLESVRRTRRLKGLTAQGLRVQPRVNPNPNLGLTLRVNPIPVG